MNKYKMNHHINVGFICPNDYWEQFHKDENDAQTDWNGLTTRVNRIMKGVKI